MKPIKTQAKLALIALLFGCSLALASDTTLRHIDSTDSLEGLEDKPYGIVRDYFISAYIDEHKDLSLQDTITLYKLIKRRNSRLTRKILARLGKYKNTKDFAKLTPYNLRCALLPLDALLKSSNGCIVSSLSLGRAMRLNPSVQRSLIDRFKDDKSAYVRDFATKLEVIDAKGDSAKKEALKKLNTWMYASFVFSLPLRYREYYLDLTSQKQIKKMLGDNKKYFNSLIEYIIIKPKMFSKMKRRLNAKDIKSENAKVSFALALNALTHDDTHLALVRLRDTYAREKSSALRDRALFWLYQVGGKKKYLKELATSKSLNLYSIYAVQESGQKPSYSIITGFEGIDKKTSTFDIKDPFAWQLMVEKIQKLKARPKELEKMQEAFATKNTLPHYIYIDNILTNYKNYYFLTPYSDKATFNSTEQKALSYAIAMQESRFLPAVVSTSYALGMMQIMPFNIQNFADNTKTHISGDTDIFEPGLALKLGGYYLEFLYARFHHPLFVAYSYNGGPNFLSRTLDNPSFFDKKRRFEPYLSMELIPYSESRTYGKKVLANYIIYNEVLAGKKLAIKDIAREIMDVVAKRRAGVKMPDSL